MERLDALRSQFRVIQDEAGWLGLDVDGIRVAVGCEPRSILFVAGSGSSNQMLLRYTVPATAGATVLAAVVTALATAAHLLRSADRPRSATVMFTNYAE